jgi:hypothetical protein
MYYFVALIGADQVFSYNFVQVYGDVFRYKFGSFRP